MQRDKEKNSQIQNLRDIEDFIVIRHERDEIYIHMFTIFQPIPQKHIVRVLPFYRAVSQKMNNGWLITG